MFYTEVIRLLRTETDEVILFHSATGKDSIMLLDLLSKSFKKVHCVFMYIVPGLEYEERYIRWAEKTYPNCTFERTPHYALYSFIKYGYLGIEKDAAQTKTSIKRIDAKIRKKAGIQWSVYGFKKVDGITRRIMLMDFGALNYKTKKAYPLMDLKNSEVLNYISDNNLILPFNYSKTKPSSGCDISQPEFLAYIKQKYPSDLQKIFNQFPFTEANLFKYENRERKEAEN